MSKEYIRFVQNKPVTGLSPERSGVTNLVYVVQDDMEDGGIYLKKIETRRDERLLEFPQPNVGGAGAQTAMFE